jgi:ubiquinone/menaquinone biosynthesis C-methylase UbiE
MQRMDGASPTSPGARNPWLDIPLEAYEGHVALPIVGQAQLLADLFEEALRAHAPRSVAMLGCAGGNGFERIGPAVERVVGVDINPGYVARALERHRDRRPPLDLYVGDIQTDAFAFAPVDLAFAGLFFEHVDVPTVMERIRPMVRAGGRLIAALQLPHDSGEVTPSPFAEALSPLASLMRLVPPDEWKAAARAAGFEVASERIEQASGGKQFDVVECVAR